MEWTGEGNSTYGQGALVNEYRNDFTHNGKEGAVRHREDKVFFTGIWPARSKSISSGSWSLSAFSARGQTRGSTTRILTKFFYIN